MRHQHLIGVTAGPADAQEVRGGTELLSRRAGRRRMIVTELWTKLFLRPSASILIAVCGGASKGGKFLWRS